MKTRASVLGLFAVLAAFAHVGAAEPAEAGVASAVAVNRAPWLRPIGDRVVPVRERIVIVPRAGDPDRGPRQLTFRASGRPGWLAINVSTGVLSGTPPRAAAGTSHRVTVIARDGAARASRTFLLRVFNARPNLRPIADRTVIAGSPLSVRLRASDADRAPQPLRFSKVFGPRWLTVDSAQRTIAGTPRLAAAGTTVRAAVRVSDGKKSMRRTFVVSVLTPEVPDSPPVLTDVAFSLPEGSGPGVVVGQVSGNDPDGDAIAYAITAGDDDQVFAIDAASGEITLAGGLDFETTPQFLLTVTGAARGVTDQATVTIDVVDVDDDPNTPPTIDTVSDVAATEGVHVETVVTATDTDGDAVAITSNLDVEGLTFTDNGDGSAALAGMPAAGTAGSGPYTVTVTADDGSDVVSESFEITIAEPDEQCPPISTAPCATIPVSLPYDLTFDGTEGGLDGTGFTIVDAPSARVGVDQSPAPTGQAYSGVPGFEPRLLDMSNGKLRITTTKGSQHHTAETAPGANSQLNALGVGVSGSATGYELSTTVVAPTSPASDGMLQQGGLWFGLDEDNYVKLVAVRLSATQYKVQLLREIGGVATATDELNSILGSAPQVTLVLEAEDTAGTGAEGGVVRASYSLEGLSPEPLADPTRPGVTEMPIPQQFFDGEALPEGGAVSFAGVFATKRDAPADEQLDVTFADFSVRDLAG